MSRSSSDYIEFMAAGYRALKMTTTQAYPKTERLEMADAAIRWFSQALGRASTSGQRTCSEESLNMARSLQKNLRQAPPVPSGRRGMVKTP